MILCKISQLYLQPQIEITVIAPICQLIWVIIVVSTVPRLLKGETHLCSIDDTASFSNIFENFLEHEDEEFECSKCQNSYKTIQHLKRHEKSCEKSFPCKSCGATFSTISNANRHCNEKFMIKCSGCSKSVRKDNFNAHQKQCTTNKINEEFSCWKCDKMVATLLNT